MRAPAASARLVGLHLYPVKGLRGLALRSAEVEPCGLAGDRRWMLVDERGQFLSQRQLPALARFDAVLSEATLRLSLGEQGIEMPRRPAPGGERIAVTVWRSRLCCHRAAVVTAGPGTTAPAPAQPGEHVSFADGFPLLLTSTGSLAALNDGLRAGGIGAVGIDRFRPNLVIEGADPWVEESWRLLRVGAVRFRAPKPCVRCAVTGIDQRSGQTVAPGEPLRTLARLRPRAGGIVFGVNLVAPQAGRLAEAAPALARLGREREAFGPGAVLVRAVPAVLGSADCQALVRDIAP